MNNVKYTEYCTCFYATKERKVYFYDEIKDKPITKLAVKDKEEANRIMKEWKDNAPAGTICDIIHDA